MYNCISARKYSLFITFTYLFSVIYCRYVNTGVSLFNGFLKSIDFPKSTLFDITRPTETLTNFFNYFFKKYLTMKVDSTPYVEPAVKYVEVSELLIICCILIHKK